MSEPSIPVQCENKDGRCPTYCPHAQEHIAGVTIAVLFDPHPRTCSETPFHCGIRDISVQCGMVG